VISKIKQTVSRSQKMFKFAGTLKRLSSQYSIAVVVVNQATERFNNTNHDNNEASSNSSGLDLTLTWANCVNTRLFLSRSTNHMHHKQLPKQQQQQQQQQVQQQQQPFVDDLNDETLSTLSYKLEYRSKEQQQQQQQHEQRRCYYLSQRTKN